MIAMRSSGFVLTFSRWARPARAVLLIVGFLPFGSRAWADGAENAGSGFVWSTASPESQGLSSQRLAAFRAELAGAHTKALLVIRNDRIVLEWYAEGVDRGSKLATASTAKAVVGGVAAALELGDGLVALDDPAAKFVL